MKIDYLNQNQCKTTLIAKARFKSQIKPQDIRLSFEE